MVAIGFMGATWAIISELKRKEQQGLMLPVTEEVKVGEPVTAMDLFWSAIIGFLLIFKVGGMFTSYMHGDIQEIAGDPMGYFLSSKGNLLAGVLGAIVFVYFRWREKKKNQLAQPRIDKITVYPHQRIGEILIMAALGGLVGAKVFNAFETWDQFLADPIGSLTSSRGLTFYGGFIVATAILYYFSRKYKIRFIHFCDAAAPAVMLAYGIGRLGCQFAGDGDWGIYNSAYVTNAATGKLEPATALQYQDAAKQYHAYFAGERQFKDDGTLHHEGIKAPSWLPQALFAQCYPHNVNGVGIPLPNCDGMPPADCRKWDDEKKGIDPHQIMTNRVLPIGVFPTPLYEAITCISLFFLLWGLRKRLKTPLHMTGIYFILSGLERFFVEKIRVNYKYDWGFLHPTQAEIISTCLVLLGITILLFYRDKQRSAQAV